MASKDLLKKVAVNTVLGSTKNSKNAFDVLFAFKNFGVGRTITRNTWKKHCTASEKWDCFWTVTRVRSKTRGPYANRGVAWGILTWKGKLYHNGEERRIRTSQKRGWMHIPDSEVFEYQKYTPLSSVVSEEEYLASLKQAEEEEPMTS